MFYASGKSFLNKMVNRVEIRAGRTRLLSWPVHLTLEPTTDCNSDCVMCNRNASRRQEASSPGFLAWETIRKVEPALRWAEQVCFSGFGEPLLHPEFGAMVRAVKGFGPFVYLFTNAVALSPEKARALVDAEVDLICVSFGGASESTYRYVRGVEMGPVVKNLRALAEIKRKEGRGKPEVHFNVVAMNSVLAELEQVVKLAAELGVTKIMMPHLSVQKPELEPESPWLSPDRARSFFAAARRQAEALGVGFTEPDLEERTNSCHELFRSMYVACDGRVLSCPMERFILGDLGEAAVRGIWNSRGMARLRESVLREGVQSVCPGCFCWDHRAETFLHPHLNSRAFATRILS